MRTMGECIYMHFSNLVTCIWLLLYSCIYLQRLSNQIPFLSQPSFEIQVVTMVKRFSFRTVFPHSANVSEYWKIVNHSVCRTTEIKPSRVSIRLWWSIFKNKDASLCISFSCSNPAASKFGYSIIIIQ